MTEHSLDSAKAAAGGAPLSGRLPAGRYVPELDGMRALAVVAVMAHHLDVPGLSVGWAGVPFFFALSGFLITGILVDARGQEHYFRNFYARRSLRIFPIYYLTLAVLVVMGLDFHWSCRTVPFYLVYVQNYYQCRRGLFDPHFPAFGHTWSLAVEEQFYLLWPVACFHLSRRSLVRCALCLLVLGTSARALLLWAAHNPILQFAPLPSEVDVLAAGALAALAIRRGAPRDRLRAASVGIGLPAAAASVALFLATGWRTSGTAAVHLRAWNVPLLLLLGVASASVIVYVSLTPSSAAARFLRQRLLVHLGKISYGLYLYHVPVFFVANVVLSHIDPRHPPGPARRVLEAAAKCALAYAVAAASYRFVERPFLRLKCRFAPAGAAGRIVAAPDSPGPAVAGAGPPATAGSAA